MVNFCTSCKYYRQDVHEEEMGVCSTFNHTLGMVSTPVEEWCFAEESPDADRE